MGVKKGVKVSVKVSNGSLQLTYRYGVDPRNPQQRKRHYKGLGLKDNPRNRAIAEGIARQLEAAFLSGTQEQFLADLFREESAPTKPQQGNLLDLWRRFEEYKARVVTEATFYKNYVLLVRLTLEKYPGLEIFDVQGIRRMLRQMPPDTQRRVAQKLRACGNWAEQEGLIEYSPLASLVPPPVRARKKEIECFTLEERDRIIEAFRASPYYADYAPLVEFLFLTGCRPSEAVALQIEKVGPDYLTFDCSATLNDQGQYRITPRLKTQDRRRFPINPQLRAVLDRAIGDRATGLVFVPPKDCTVINISNFGKRAWSTCLKAAGVRHRSLYHTRHTFITYCGRASIPEAEIARWVGNSPATIFNHYSAAIGDIAVPRL